MKLRRGFKTEANTYAREFRTEMRLADHAPLCPWQLADHLAIPVLPLSELASELAKEHFAYLTGPAQSSFSAVTVFRGYRRLIVHNDAHHRHRQAANIAHELAHGILGHPPAPPLDDHGCRNFDRALEDEANWLGPALLISDEAALHIVETGMTIPRAVQAYGVSPGLLTMRLRVTGARTRIDRRRAAKYAR